MRGKHLNYDDPILKETIKKYKDQGYTKIQMEDKVGLNRSTLTRLYKHYGWFINTRPTVDKDFFETIDTEAKAWCLGLMFSDGNVYNNRIQLRLQESDREVVDQFKTHLKYTGNMYLGKERSVKGVSNNKTYTAKAPYGISVYNKKLTEDLAKHGCIPNKTLVAKFPDTIPKHLIPSFIRGYIDGDGYIGYNKQRNNYRIHIKGTEHILNGIKDYIISLGRTANVHKTKNANCYHLELVGVKNVLRFLNEIYGTSTKDTRMERKYEKACEVYRTIQDNRVKPSQYCFVGEPYYHLNYYAQRV